jgi:poly(A) polymerase
MGSLSWADRVLIAWAEALIAGRNEDADRWLQLLTLPTRWPVPVLPLKGRDLRAVGLKPGPQIGELLAALEAWWIDQDFTPDRQACLDWVKGRLAE